MHPLLLLSLIAACNSGFPVAGPGDDDDSSPAHVSLDDDDTAADDDDTAADDDDTAADDDDDGGLFEGDQPGECSDGADNDQDGLFDCMDPNCFGAPDCQGDDDDTADDDDATPADDDDATPADDDDTADDDDATPADDDDATPADDDDTLDTFEGDEPGECSDGIDNDGDFLVDCDDPTCNLTSDCGGGDDDDATAPLDGSPLITDLVGTWLPSVNELNFDITVTDGDCDLGHPILGWTFNGPAQAPVTLGGPPLTCNVLITFGVQSVSPGFTYQLTFTVTDSAGHTSAPWPITIIAS